MNLSFIFNSKMLESRDESRSRKWFNLYEIVKYFIGIKNKLSNQKSNFIKSGNTKPFFTTG